jgi:ABC-type glycerol-3-phosphate transport system substrate-binding protein
MIDKSEANTKNQTTLGDDIQSATQTAETPPTPESVSKERGQVNTPTPTQVVPEKKDDYPYYDYSGLGEEEEFTYKPKVGFTFGKIAKILGPILILLLIVVPIVFVVLKLRAANPKVVSKKGEIVWLGLGLKKEVVQPLINEYISQNPQAKINYIEDSPTDYRERLINSILQGKSPDIFTYHNSWVPMFKDYLDVMPKEVMTYDNFAKLYYPVMVGNLTTGAGVVGLPLEYDGITLFINENIFSTAGRVAPTTWDEFHQAAIDLTTRNDKNIIIQSGAALGITSNVDYWPEIIALLLFQSKADLYSPQGQGTEEALSFFADFYTFDKVWDNTLPSSTEAFAEGKLAMLLAPARAVNEIKKLNANLHFRSVPLPQVRRDNPEEPDVAYATYWAQGVWSKSPNKELAWDFLRFLSKKESLEEIYKNSTAAGLVGMAYPRIDMRDELISDPIMGSIVALAPDSKSCLSNRS